MPNLGERLLRRASAPADWKATLLGHYAEAGTFVDVGANTGQTLQDWLAQPRQGRYIGFEPIPSCASAVQALLDANPVDGRVVPVALTAEPMVAELFIPGNDLRSATLLSGLRPGRNDRTLVIAGLPFDAVWSQLGDGPIDVVKIDVEGGELDALRGMTLALRTHQPPILCEVLRRDPAADVSAYETRVTNLRALLSEHGYRAYRIVKPRAEIEGFELIESFPAEAWSDATSEDNDYLLLPEGSPVPNL